MKSLADKMFEDLGYSKKVCEHTNSIEYSKEWGEYEEGSGYEFWTSLVFWLNSETVEAAENYEAKTLSWDELEAITAKAGELGWNKGSKQTFYKESREEDFMNFYNTIYNAMYLYLVEKGEHVDEDNPLDAIEVLSKKYMDIIEEPLSDAIHDALMELGRYPCDEFE